MNTSTPLSLLLGRFKQLPQRSSEIWRGGLVKVPVWVESEAASPYRPTAAFWVSLRTGLVNLALPEAGDVATPELALRTLIEFGLKVKGVDGRPAAVEVRDAEVQQALATALAPLGIDVRLVEAMPEVTAALQHLGAATTGGPDHAGMLEGTGVTPAQLRAFAEAAAAFYEAAPWRHLMNEDLLVADAPLLPTHMRHLVVLGKAGQQFGLSFFDSRRAFDRIYQSSKPYRPDRACGVTFGPIDELPFADVDAWEEMGLPVAGPRGYPLAGEFRSNGTLRRFDVTELAAAEGLLRAMAQTTEDQLDEGTWQQRVDTFVGPMQLELSLPLLLEQEAARAAPDMASDVKLSLERVQLRLARALEGQKFESVEMLEAAVDRLQKEGRLEQSAEAAAGRPLTALEQAQEVAYDAGMATGRRRIKLARRALALSSDCADACVLLGDAAATEEEALEWYRRGVDAGARALGVETFASLVGSFWMRVETRPYMRARLALAELLLSREDTEAALDHYRALLRLNPNDNQGVRHLLLPVLIEEGHGDEADRLLAEYDQDPHAVWKFARALRLFQRDGDSARARSALKAAVKANPHVVGYLLDPDDRPQGWPSHYSLGSREEAVSVANSLDVAYTDTPGALDWLRSAASPPAPRRRRQRR